ncbi:MAG: hypothetical protein SF052_12180 [Bacteroidia bacterium]|nr:hypothetical protein [Bacteroidia bacterium]
MPTTKLHSPYLYLAKSADDPKIYYLYVAINYLNGETVSDDGIEAFDSGITHVASFKVEGSPTSSVEKTYYKKHTLNLKEIPDGFDASIDPTHPNAFSIKCDCQKVGESTQSITLYYYYYKDNPVPEAGADTNIAYNCPYLYLMTPDALAGVSLGADFEIKFYPYCKVPLKGFINNGNFIIDIPDITLYDGVLAKRLTLSNSLPTPPPTEIAPNAILFNGVEYTEQNEILEYFTVEVYAGGSKKGVGRIRNMDSDTNPSSFLDVSPF